MYTKHTAEWNAFITRYTNIGVPLRFTDSGHGISAAYAARARMMVRVNGMVCVPGSDGG